MADLESSMRAARVRVMQIIAGALILGSGIYLGIAVLVRAQGNAQPVPDPPLLTYISIGFAAMMIVAAWTFPAQLIRARLLVMRTQATTDDSFVAVYQIQLIIRLAQLEGAAFFGATAYLSEGSPLSLGASLLLIVLMLSQFPTTGRVERWVQSMRTIDRDGAVHTTPRKD
jgi:hypothetical protein